MDVYIAHVGRRRIRGDVDAGMNNIGCSGDVEECVEDFCGEFGIGEKNVRTTCKFNQVTEVKEMT